MSGLAFSADEILENYESFPRVDTLAVGNVGLVGVKGLGVVHIIGYGMGSEGLQVLSGVGGELGFADNDAVMTFYEQYYGLGKAGLYEVQPRFAD